MSVGGGKSEGQSSNTSLGEQFGTDVGFSGSSSYIDPSQAPYLDQLRQQAFSTFNQANPQINALGDQLLGQGNAVLGQMQQAGNTQQIIDAQLTGLRSGLNDIHSQGLNSIGDNAAAAGAFGGARQGVAEGVLGGEIGKAYTQGYGDIMANASQQALQANSAAGALIPQLFNLGMGSQFGGLGALQGLLGDPTVLSDAFGANVGQKYGYNYGTGQSTDSSGKFGFVF
ncbi:hypothetical protein [Tropicibacter sp. Alg240-R139]|uniref:hypothetical protein n=1 Tax=Tropicibacter sp. Alg240-R139 TaxID=2305991 RepID=UPI0013DFEB72|nr:hypothetical protein [Tropicibacter sp. Alg240-R139]